MRIWITTGYYGGDILLIEHAANGCGTQLVAVKGYALEDFPEDREYVEGEAEYLFFLERDTLREAQEVACFALRDRVRELASQKYGG
jgi:hypothetical protein